MVVAGKIASLINVLRGSGALCSSNWIQRNIEHAYHSGEILGHGQEMKPVFSIGPGLPCFYFPFLSSPGCILKVGVESVEFRALKVKNGFVVFLPCWSDDRLRVARVWACLLFL